MPTNGKRLAAHTSEGDSRLTRISSANPRPA